MKLAFWDMDHTIIDNDCDVSWKEFLVAEGLAPTTDLALKDQFYQDYLNGVLDSVAFSNFQLREFRNETAAAMAAISDRHFDTMVRSRIYPEAARLIDEQQAADIPTILLTATNAVIAQPLARKLKMPTVLATQLEQIDGRYTGKTTGIYCCAEGKAQILADYAAEHGIALSDCAYYGDSTADIPVLASVGHPSAINPGENLQAAAAANAWPILRFPRLG